MANDYILEENQKQDKALMEDADYFTSKDEKKYRVLMVIYDSDEGKPEKEDFPKECTWTDEPLYSNEDEISVQAYRTQKYFKQKNL